MRQRKVRETVHETAERTLSPESLLAALSAGVITETDGRGEEFFDRCMKEIDEPDRTAWAVALLLGMMAFRTKQVRELFEDQFSNSITAWQSLQFMIDENLWPVIGPKGITFDRKPE